ncbi:DMT family transporter [Ensifer sesbaniae]|uniref:DMT family transporter n=1 Tax=Ensifer sesbaniae TaxID=1214071 RepID=UPI0015682935|nr:multidrug efflux SMR transporter [Ensifer sesbaniae]NRQ13376.1 Quaternary ammonium compound-resistance protein SugE [Ensifer sesbaniae]
MAWILLIAASLIEIVMGLALKYADGWTKLVPSAVGIAAALGSVYLLTIAMRDLPAGTAYAAWTGIGSVGITVLGIVLFGDPVSWLRVTCIAMIIVAVAGLRFLEA